MFRGEIFIPKKKPLLNLTLSEKLNWGSLLGILIYFSLFQMDEKWNSSEIKHYVIEHTYLNQVLGVIFGISFFASIFMRFQEFENLNGELKGKLIIDESEITIDDKIYDLSKIQDFKIKITDYFGQRTNYSKSGPYYYQGINNMLSFIYDGEIIALNFQIYSERYTYDLKVTLLNIICKEKIPFHRSYLKIIDDEYKDTPSYKKFIEKLLLEKRVVHSETI
jgi:hypothetical protein